LYEVSKKDMKTVSREIGFGLPTATAFQEWKKNVLLRKCKIIPKKAIKRVSQII